MSENLSDSQQQNNLPLETRETNGESGALNNKDGSVFKQNQGHRELQESKPGEKRLDRKRRSSEDGGCCQQPKHMGLSTTLPNSPCALEKFPSSNQLSLRERTKRIFGNNHIAILEEKEQDEEENALPTTFTMEREGIPTRPTVIKNSKDLEVATDLEYKEKPEEQYKPTIQSNNATSQVSVPPQGVPGCGHINEYTILDFISAGGFGEVLSATNKRTDELVALKKFRCENGQFPKSALREISLLQKVKPHENIVAYKGVLVGNAANEIYMIMELVDYDLGETLGDLIKENKVIGLHMIKSFTVQVLRGVEHLHNQNILHRDLKTNNILLSRSGVLKIADFGMSRDMTNSSTNLTPVVVTVWYRSPELLLHTKKYSKEIDMWSVGCIMAEFITMEPLFQEDSELKLLNLIFNLLGTPTEETWPEVTELDAWKSTKFEMFPPGQLKSQFVEQGDLSETGYSLLEGLLTVNPKKRISASVAVSHPWFKEYPSLDDEPP